MANIVIDFETKSEANLLKVGAWAYSEHPTTEMICVCWKVDDGPIQSWTPKTQVSDHEAWLELMKLVSSDATVEAHNVAFERSIWTNVLAPKHGWPLPKDSQWRDLMAVASYYALPPPLDKLAQALGMGAKDPEGDRLITKYAKLHLKTAKREIPPADMEKWLKYCAQDVHLEYEIGLYLGELPKRELPVFQMDQRMNMRGLRLDIENVKKARAIVAGRAAALTEEFRKLTGLSPAQNAAVKKWFFDRGADFENLQAEYLELPRTAAMVPAGDARRALDIRLAINKAGTKKLDAMLRQVGKDGRARFQTRYHGAATGRNTGFGIQPLNMSRGIEKMDPEQLIRDISHGDAELLDLLYGDAIRAISKATRNFILADSGCRLIAGDYSSIEAIILACLAGEQWKIDAFKSGAKIYEMMGDKIYGLPAGTVTKDTHPDERQDGKIGELAFGYQGALGAWRGFDSSDRHSDERVLEICRAWRDEHPATTALWKRLNEAAICAVLRGSGPVEAHTHGVAFEIVDEWLTCILPNGKRLWYREPEVKMVMPHWHEPEVRDDCFEGTCDCRPHQQLTYMAWKFGRWVRTATYGGKLTENVVQAVSRELLVDAALRVEKAGYNIVLTVYDEIVVEMPNEFGSVKEIESIMSAKPAWAADWPVSVSGWASRRYKK